MISSYVKIMTLGHKSLHALFEDDVVVEEKFDGSQFSWTLTPDCSVEFRSKRTTIYPGAGQKLFEPAMASVLAFKDRLVPSWVYRGEAFQRPRHNTLKYNRVPLRHIVLFDVEREAGTADYLSHVEKAQVAEMLGIEVPPAFYVGKVDSAEQVKKFLERESSLGGPLIEGVVVKNYARFGPDGHPLMGKYVSEAFKETHKGTWKSDNPNRADIIDQLIESLRTPARWQKAIQHLRDDGTLLDDPKDIGPLLKELARDLLDEEKEWIKEQLFAHFSKRIVRGASAGFPEYYKKHLLDQQFAASLDTPPEIV